MLTGSPPPAPTDSPEASPLERPTAAARVKIRLTRSDGFRNRNFHRLPGSQETGPKKTPTPWGLLRASDEAKPLALQGAAPVGSALRRTTAACFSSAGVTGVNTNQSTRWSFMLFDSKTEQLSGEVLREDIERQAGLERRQPANEEQKEWRYRRFTPRRTRPQVALSDWVWTARWIRLQLEMEFQSGN